MEECSVDHNKTAAKVVEVEIKLTTCSFCGKTNDQVSLMINSNDKQKNGRVHICNVCVCHCAEIMIDRARMMKGKILDAVAVLNLGKEIFNATRTNEPK